MGHFTCRGTPAARIPVVAWLISPPSSARNPLQLRSLCSLCLQRSCIKQMDGHFPALEEIHFSNPRAVWETNVSVVNISHSRKLQPLFRAPERHDPALPWPLHCGLWVVFSARGNWWLSRMKRSRNPSRYLAGASGRSCQTVQCRQFNSTWSSDQHCAWNCGEKPDVWVPARLCPLWVWVYIQAHNFINYKIMPPVWLPCKAKVLFHWAATDFIILRW